MKELSELNLPGDVRYAEEHEWVRTEGGAARIGISDYAQDQLGDVVFVELPSVGESFVKGDVFGTVESVKAVSELVLPVGGEITAVNDVLEEAPEKVNTAPYGEGWMVQIRLADSGEMDALMDTETYLNFLKG